jgi:ribosomal protein S27AE
MANHQRQDAPEIEIICPRCHYQMQRSAERLRRQTEILCPNCGAVVVPPSNKNGPMAEG